MKIKSETPTESETSTISSNDAIVPTQVVILFTAHDYLKDVNGLKNAEIQEKTE